MRNKKQLSLLSVVLAAGMIFGACSPKPSPTSESSIPSSQDSSSSMAPTPSSSSSIPVVNKYTVKFVVDGVEKQVSQVEEGKTASYTGEEPTKAPDMSATKYRFKGWDKDVSKPITADTTFTAQFAAYAYQQVIDDFESYESNGDMTDAGWKALGYNNTTQTWTIETGAAVTLGSKSVEGNKALRFDAWENNVGYKFAKDIGANDLTKCANALKFRLQVPSINTVKVILVGSEIDIPTLGKKTPSFTYTLKPTTSEYVEYIIPIADSGWALWSEAGKTIPIAAGMAGIHEDDFVPMLTRIEFYVQGDDGIGGQDYFAFLDSVRFITLDEPVTKSEVETMSQYTRYTGLLNDGHTVKVELGANGAATATVIDMEEPQVIPGNVTTDANKNMTFTSADNGATLVYKAQLKNGGQSMKFVEASGAFKEAVSDVNLNAVQVVDNYEQYVESGKMYYQSNMDMNARSGARGAYYGEYFSGGSHEYETFGGNGWVLMAGNGDQVSLMKDGGHSGNNYLSLKNSNGNAMRYMQFGLFDGTSEQNNFRGSKLSFWAKTNGKVPEFKVAMYSQSKPRNNTIDKQVRQQVFKQTAAISQWTHFEVDLNPALTYCGFLVFMEKNGASSASYLYIDDVEVYTANPYAKYEAPVQPVVQDSLENGQVFCGRMMGIASAMIAIGKDSNAHFGFAGTTTMSVDGTYSANGNRVTFDFGSSAGQLVVDVNDTFDKLTVVEGTSGFSRYFTAGMLLNEMDVLDNAETYTESGKMYYQNMTDKKARSGARGAYYCDYFSGGSGSDIGGSGWSLMGGSGDQLSLETNADNVHSGNNSLKLKRNKANTMRYSTWGLHDGSAEGHTGANYFMYYAKNPNNDPLTIKTSVYYQAQVTPATQQSNRDYLEAVIPAKSDWVPVVIPLDPAKTYYGVAYTAATISDGSGADYFYIDDAIFYSEEMNIGSAYGVCKGLTLAGTIAGGAAEASITFGDSNNAVIACSTLGLSLNVKFTLIDGVLKIKAPAIQGGSGSEIVGNYGQSAEEFVMSLTITSVTGDLASYIATDSVFQGRIPNM